MMLATITGDTEDDDQADNTNTGAVGRAALMMLMATSTMIMVVFLVLIMTLRAQSWRKVSSSWRCSYHVHVIYCIRGCHRSKISAGSHLLLCSQMRYLMG